MRLDRATIDLIPRTTAQCLDAATMFAGRHLKPILQLYAFIAGPSCAAIYFLCHYYENGLLPAAGIVYFATSTYGVLLIAGAAPSAFGEPFTWNGMLRRGLLRNVPLVLRSVLMRIAILAGLALCVIPGVWLAVRTGFGVEQKVLSRLGRTLHTRRTDELVSQRLADLVVRAAWILAYGGVLVVVMFVTFDLGLSFLLGIDGALMRMQDGAAAPDQLFRHDPYTLSLLAAAVFFVYPIGRLAWLFCYIDLRVRLDLWDMELQFLQERARLEGAA